MEQTRWHLRLLLLSLLVTAVMLTSSFSKGGTMHAEDFFSGQELAAYHFAQQGDLERLLHEKRGVDLNRPGKQDMTMLGLAVIKAERRAIVTLMRAGADPNQVIPDAGSPAILAITRHSTPPDATAVEALLDGGYDPNQLLSRGTPYLFYFVDYEHWPGLKLALHRGGNINATRNKGESLLTYLIERGQYAKARELMAMGADVTVRGDHDETALEAIESRIRRADPSAGKVWRELLEMRKLILSKLPDPKDRRSVFTDQAEAKIRQNSIQ